MDVQSANPERTSTRAVLALVFGILGVTCALPCAGPIIAIVLGTGEPGGVARAGTILGWIAVALYAFLAGLALLLWLLNNSAIPAPH